MASHTLTVTSPADGATGVARNATLQFTVNNLIHVSLLTVTASINGGSAIPIMTLGADQSGYTSVTTPHASSIDVVITRAALWPAASTVVLTLTTPNNAYTNAGSFKTDGQAEAYIHPSPLNGLTSATVSIIHRPGTGMSNAGINIFYYGGANTFNAFNLTTGRLSVVVSDGGANTYTWTSSNNVFADNTSYKIVIVYQGGGSPTLTVYVNSTTALTPATTTGSLPASIANAGADLYFRDHFNVTGIENIDEFAIWQNTVLTSGQIADLLNGGETANLADGSHLYETPNYYYPFNADVHNYGTGGTLDVTLGAFTGTNAVDTTTATMTGQGTTNLNNSSWDFTTLSGAKPQVFLIM